MAVIRKLEKEKQEQNTLYIIDKKRNQEEHNDSNWIISYADMMTLLCIFFIMLFSMSKVNTPEFEAMKKQVAEHFGTKYESPTEDLGKFVNNIITEAGVAKDATMTNDGMSVSVAFHSTMFFDTLSAEVSPAGKAIIEKIATQLYDYQVKHGKKYKIVVEGHTDSQPVVGGPFPSNWELSSSRATRVVRLFLDKKFDAPNLLAIGYADTQPVAPSRNPDGSWNVENLTKNRRVILRVLMPEVDNIPWKVNDVKSGTTSTEPTGTVTAPAVAPVATVDAVPAAPAPVATGESH
jgi:chemotaxis protein MotB